MLEELKQHKILLVTAVVLLLFVIISLVLGLVFIKRKNGGISIPHENIVNPTPVVSTSNMILIPFTTNNSLTPIPTTSLDTTNSIQVKDFLTAATKTDAGDFIITNADKYTITYTPDTHKFLITISDTPFTQLRETAEQALLAQLGITPQQACKITIAVTTPATVNPDYAAFEYAPSFCFTPKQNQDFETAVYLANHLPSSNNYMVSADYVADPYYHYQFTVFPSNGIDKPEVQKEFTDWMHSINLSDSQIQNLDIVYQSPLQYEAPPSGAAPTNASY